MFQSAPTCPCDGIQWTAPPFVVQPGLVANACDMKLDVEKGDRFVPGRMTASVHCSQPAFVEDFGTQGFVTLLSKQLVEDIWSVVDARLPEHLEEHLVPRIRSLIKGEMGAACVSASTPCDLQAPAARADAADVNYLVPTLRRDLPSAKSATSDGYSAHSSPQRTATALLEQAVPVVTDDNAICGIVALDPSGRTRTIWNGLSLCFFMFDLFSSTFEWAFLSHQLRDPHELYSIYTTAVFVSNLFWVVDIFLNFCTGYVDDKKNAVVLSCPLAVLQYLRTWFCVDLFSVTVSILASPVLKNLRFLKLARFSKMWALKRRMMRLQTAGRSKQLMCMVCVLQLILFLFSASHVVGCIFFFAGKLNVGRGLAENSWLATGLNGQAPLYDASVLQQYINTMHLSLSIMTGVGNVSFNTLLIDERCLMGGYSLIAMVLMGLVINEVTVIYSNMRQGSELVINALEEASNFMGWYAVPSDLQTRVERYLQNVFAHKEHMDNSMRLRDWLQASDGLFSELCLSIFGRCLHEHPQLRLLTREQLGPVCELCETVFFPPGEVVALPGAQPTKMLALRSGKLELTLSGDGSRKSSGTSPRGAKMVPCGGILFQRELLLPAAEKDNRHTAICRSFCEIIVLDIYRFNAELGSKRPQLLQALRIYAAIEEDSADLLSWALQDGHIGHEDILFSGETMLHACARLGATSCINWLMHSCDVCVDTRDARHQTPIEVARAMGNKAAVDALVMNGAAVVADMTDWRPFWSEPRMRLVQDRRQGIEVEALRERLLAGGVDLNSWGTAGAKSVVDFMEEIKAGTSICVTDSGGEALRILSIVRIKISAVIGKRTKVLNLTECGKWMAQANRTVKLPMRRVCGGDLQRAIEELWSNGLGLGSHFVAKHFERGVELVYEEEKPTATYPGLRCVYIVTEVPYWPRNPASDELACIGLPKGMKFETFEPRENGSPRKNTWLWMAPFTPPLAEQANTLMERLGTSGVDVASWVPCSDACLLELAKEIEAGLCVCFEDADGSLRRELKSVRIRVCNGLGKTLHQIQDGGPMKLPMKDIVEGRLEHAVNMFWFDDLGIGLDSVTQCFERGEPTVCKEEVETTSYPGLRCVRMVHDVSYTFHGGGYAACAGIGLPLGTSFSRNSCSYVWERST
mmetsp:Transcript_38184/g.105262  ORF Transcript_38184/g.105262 Transcript_38184/m.105262 type:complete len:1147 (-) Transcript_38184:116-3556(-)